jgi:hypothetical protein
MNNIYKGLTLIAMGGFALAGCDVDKTKNGQMPDVDVDVNATGGQLPEFNVNGPDVNVGTENKTVQVPTVDVDVPAEGDNEKK